MYPFEVVVHAEVKKRVSGGFKPNTGRDEISLFYLDRGEIDTSRVVNERLLGEDGSNLRHGFADVVEAELYPFALGVKVQAILDFQLPPRTLAPPDRIRPPLNGCVDWHANVDNVHSVGNSKVAVPPMIVGIYTARWAYLVDQGVVLKWESRKPACEVLWAIATGL